MDHGSYSNNIIPLEICQIIMKETLLSICREYVEKKGIHNGRYNILHYVFEYIRSSLTFSAVSNKLYNIFSVCLEKNICNLINNIYDEDLCEDIIIELLSKLFKKKDNIVPEICDLFDEYISDYGRQYLFVSCYKSGCDIWKYYPPDVEQLVKDINYVYYDENNNPITIFVTHNAMEYIIKNIHKISNHAVRKLKIHITLDENKIKYSYEALHQIIKYL